MVCIPLILAATPATQPNPLGGTFFIVFFVVFNVLVYTFMPILVIGVVRLIYRRLPERWRQRSSRSHRTTPAIPRDSAALVGPEGLRRHPVLAFIALVSGLISIVGGLCYFFAPAVGPALAIIGFCSMIVAAVIVGIIFGTSDRDFYT